MTFLLAHLSDPHIGPLPQPLKRDLIGKRFTGWLNWQGGRRELHDMRVLSRIVADIKAHGPDHVAMTGDILNIGLPSEFPLASAWLDTLGSREDVSFVPGNHDAYVRGSMPYLSQTFAPWTGDHAPVAAHFPYVRLRGRVAIIGLSSGIPTPPFVASGRLGLPQRQAFARILEETKARGLMRVVMIHHPPYRQGASVARGLIDAAEFEKIIRSHGAELIVHGHNHRSMVARLASTRGSTPVVGVASASAVPGSYGHRAAWNLYAIKETGGGRFSIELRVRGILPESTAIGDIRHESIA